MVRSELVAILLSHGLGGVKDPEVRVATGPRTSEPCGVCFVPSDDAYGPHVRLVPHPNEMTAERRRELLRWAVASAIEADLWVPDVMPRPGEMAELLDELGGPGVAP